MVSRRILIVDDSAVVRALHSYILRSVGFETVLADSGFAALEALQQSPCDLAVVDINMPLMDGLTLIRQIRADPATRGLPIIIVSSEQEAKDKRKGFEAGANVYVVKPTEPEELLANVRMLLGAER
jgi:two-component system chemotaxis response regulator CheY